MSVYLANCEDQKTNDIDTIKQMVTQTVMTWNSDNYKHSCDD